MTVAERVEQIIAERNGASSQSKQVLRDDETFTELDKEVLARCDGAMHTFGVIESLREIHQKVLGGRGELSEDSYLVVEKDRVAVAKATLSLRREEGSMEPRQISVSIKKVVGSNRPFELAIESSEDLEFSMSVDTPEADQLTRDGDIGRWDIRGIEDLDDNLGFFSSPDELRSGIEDRLAKVSVQLLAGK
jgi:hypothetical protein